MRYSPGVAFEGEGRLGSGGSHLWGSYFLVVRADGPEVLVGGEGDFDWAFLRLSFK